MKKAMLTLIPAFIMGVSCSKEDMRFLLNNTDEISLNTRSTIDEIVNLHTGHKVSVSSAKVLLNSRFSEKEVDDIQTVKCAGRDLLHVVNFDDGWAIVSGDDRADAVVLAYSEEGSFDPDNITNPEVAYWFDMTKQYLIGLSANDTEDSMVMSGVNEPEALLTTDEEQYYWLKVLIDNSDSEDTQSRYHLINTHWGQKAPWNYKTPDPYGSAYNVTGCISVALSQIMYYLNQYYDYPTGLYHEIDPTYDGPYSDNDGYPYYIISNANRGSYNANSSRWAYMPWTKNGSYTDYVGDLMIDIGARIGMRYYATSSGIDNPITPMQNVLSQYGVGSSSSNYSYSTVKSSLNSYQPVIIAAYENVIGEGKHVWIIDGYVERTISNTKTYQWRTVASDSLSYYTPVEILTESQMQATHPGVQEYDLDYVTTTSTSKYIMMNWGFDDENAASYDNAVYSINSSGWAYGTPTPKIIYYYYDLNN